MAEITLDCVQCPKTLEARSLFRSESGTRYCFECPLGLRSSRFESLVQRANEGRVTAIRSCRRVTPAIHA